MPAHSDETGVSRSGDAPVSPHGGGGSASGDADSGKTGAGGSGGGGLSGWGIFGVVLGVILLGSAGHSPLHLPLY